MTEFQLTAFFILLIFFFEMAAQRAWIGRLRELHVSQVQKAYGTHIDETVKAKVPSMGGVVFLLIGSGLLLSQIFRGNAEGAIFWCYPVLSAAVGLTDDILKYRRKSSEGLSSLRKFFLQAITTVLWFILMAVHHKTPCLLGNFSVGAWIWPAAFFFAVGIQNSVNVTDGLDGLAAGASAVTFAALLLLSPDGYNGSPAGIALSLGFLWHNCHPARIFMGDVGAHFLAGLMASCAFMGQGGVLALIPCAMGFGLEMLSVVIQLIAIHGWGRRVFRMSPVHHHFQLLGWPEDVIVTRFLLVHGLLVFFFGVLLEPLLKGLA